jgi:hypothetical protein
MPRSEPKLSAKAYAAFLAQADASLRPASERVLAAVVSLSRAAFEANDLTLLPDLVAVRHAVGGPTTTVDNTLHKLFREERIARYGSRGRFRYAARAEDVV